jgi:hypothetical protein
MGAHLEDDILHREASVDLVAEIAELLDDEALHLRHIHADESRLVAGLEDVEAGNLGLKYVHCRRSPVTGAGSTGRGAGGGSSTSSRRPLDFSSASPRFFFTSSMSRVIRVLFVA